MNQIHRLSPVEASKKFIEIHFPACNGAVLAGSVVRGEGTETSDLDIVVFEGSVSFSYRESLLFEHWPIEIFVHNLHSYKDFYKMDCESGTPSMPKMVSEGIVLKGEELLANLKKEAQQILDQGPAAWTEKEIAAKRYFLTDTMDDFIGCKERSEEIFIAGSLAEMLSEFILRSNNCWIGHSKWLPRALRQFDKAVADEFVRAFDLFYQNGDKKKIIHLADKTLKPFGGRLFEGFSVGKEEN